MRRIVIIGGGFSGTLVAVHLLRAGTTHEPLQVTLIESAPIRANCGVAFQSRTMPACSTFPPQGWAPVYGGAGSFPAMGPAQR